MAIRTSSRKMVDGADVPALVLGALEEDLLDPVHDLVAPGEQRPTVEGADDLAGVVDHRGCGQEHQAVRLDRVVPRSRRGRVDELDLGRLRQPG